MKTYKLQNKHIASRKNNSSQKVFMKSTSF